MTREGGRCEEWGSSTEGRYILTCEGLLRWRLVICVGVMMGGARLLYDKPSVLDISHPGMNGGGEQWG